MPRIAVIDDDQTLIDLVTDVFREKLWTVITVPDTHSVVASLGIAGPDVILLDVRLGGNQSGWEILQDLRSQPETHAIPVVIWTADEKGLDEKRAWLHDLRVPALSKPLDIDDLYRCIEQVLPDTLQNETNPLELLA